MDSSVTKSKKIALQKMWRFTRIYGFSRTSYKVAGRMRSAFAQRILGKRKARVQDVAMLGCGQFAFATIGYFMNSRFGSRFLTCFDIDAERAESFANFFRGTERVQSASRAIACDGVRYVYVASNHASHTPYAIEALSHGKTVYVEKPISVNWEQFSNLVTAVETSSENVFAGYNRPHSQAIRRLESWCHERHQPLTISCFVSGHVLAPDHWYREPDEGTRICGNVGHWLDLAVHMLLWGTLEDQWEITLAWSQEHARDDDLAISLTSSRGDLVNIVLTARTEPFEGINETINIQWGNTIAKIDDFRSLTVWREQTLKKYRFRPKDVGHRAAIMQPFQDNAKMRPWGEVELSTMLMLKIAEMTVAGERFARFSFSQQWQQIVGDDIPLPLEELVKRQDP